MKVVLDSESEWVEGKDEMDYKKKVLMDNVPPTVNLIQSVIIPPGGKIPVHAHKNTTEMFYITNGKVRMKLVDEELMLNTRDMVLVEVGEEHGFINNSNEPLEMVVLKINFKKDDAVLYSDMEVRK